MINLRLDCYFIKLHPQTHMKNLGITYDIAVPQSIADQWWFFNCKNVPENLPFGLKKMDIPIEKLIGYGLSQNDIDFLNSQK